MSEGEGQAEDRERAVAVAFLGGALTVGTIATAFFVVIGIRVGFDTIWERFSIGSANSVLEIPSDLIDELTATGAVIDNADNPTGVSKHDTILVQPHEEFAYTLRPGVSIDCYMLRSIEPLNLDPPVLYIESSVSMSPALRSYVAENSRLSYTYTTTSEGFRRTLPETDAERKILMVGDSGLFGIGVDDADTIASNLQKLAGDSYEVVNAGVGGYSGDQAFRVARSLSEKDEYSLLVYVAHGNDLHGPKKLSDLEKTRGIFDRFGTLRDRFPDGIIVALITYLEYTGNDVLLQSGWKKQKRVEALDDLRRELPKIAREFGFPFVDLNGIADDVRKQEESIFSPWALYVDHAHLSPRGARLLAERIFEQMPEAAVMHRVPERPAGRT